MNQRLKFARPLANLKQGRSDWYRITSKLIAKDEDGGGTYAEVMIYDEIGYFGVTAQDFVRDLNQVSDSKIELRLNSPGGDLFEGLAIYSALKSHRAEVRVTVDGLAASAASFIAMAGDTVRMHRNAQLMIHDGTALVIGNAKDMAAMVELLDKQSDNIADIYAQKAGGTKATWRKAMQDETWYTADEAVKTGLADEVLETESKNGTGPTNTWDLSIFNHPNRAAAPAPVLPDPQADVQSVEGVDLDSLTKALEGAFR